MSNFHIVLMYCIPSPLAALKFWYWLTQVHLDNGHKHWEREMETERERERERERDVVRHTNYVVDIFSIYHVLLIL